MHPNTVTPPPDGSAGFRLDADTTQLVRHYILVVNTYPCWIGQLTDVSGMVCLAVNGYSHSVSQTFTVGPALPE